MGPRNIRILLADDHQVLRQGIILSLSRLMPEAEFGEAGNDSEVLKLTAESEWDLVILDLTMPGRDGIQILKEIKAANRKIPVIIFSGHTEEQFAVRSIRAGASGYIRKNVPIEEFTLAIRRVLSGERYFSPKVVDLMANELSTVNDMGSHLALSDREYQVFLLISSGMSVSQISEKLAISVKTVSVYRSNILKKLNLKNNSEITHYAFKNNLVLE